MTTLDLLQYCIKKLPNRTLDVIPVLYDLLTVAGLKYNETADRMRFYRNLSTAEKVIFVCKQWELEKMRAKNTSIEKNLHPT